MTDDIPRMADLRVSEEGSMAYAVKHRGLILVRTVTDSEVGAMVNWLVTYCGHHVTNEWSDERIRGVFAAQRDLGKGPVNVIRVIVQEREK